MNRFLFFVANCIGAAVLALLVIDRTRDLRPIFVLLAFAVLFALLPWARERVASSKEKPDGATASISEKPKAIESGK
jgi:hypothetical protein